MKEFDVMRWAEDNHRLAEKAFQRWYDEVWMDSRRLVDKIYNDIIRERGLRVEAGKSISN